MIHNHDIISTLTYQNAFHNPYNQVVNGSRIVSVNYIGAYNFICNYEKSRLHFQ